MSFDLVCEVYGLGVHHEVLFWLSADLLEGYERGDSTYIAGRCANRFGYV